MNDKYIDVLNIEKDIADAEFDLTKKMMDFYSINKEEIDKINDTNRNLDMLKCTRKILCK